MTDPTPTVCPAPSRNAERARRRAALELVFERAIADCATVADRLNQRRNTLLDAVTP
jgi:hypothetical protein